MVTPQPALEKVRDKIRELDRESMEYARSRRFYTGGIFIHNTGLLEDEVSKLSRKSI